MEFWTEPQMASIHKMLNPRSIAIVGATPRMQYGGRFLAAALKAKDRIRVYAVNPRYDEIMGVKSYPSVTSLPEALDLVGIVVPWDQVHLDRARGRPRLYRFRPLSARRPGYPGNCRFCRRLQRGPQVSRSGKARSRARQAHRPHQNRAFGTGSQGCTLAYCGADACGCPLRCDLCPIRGDPGPGLRRTSGGLAPPGPHPQARRPRHRGAL